MSRNVVELHPVLQQRVRQLIDLCAKNGISIGISECVRTVAEQDALYAKGRTKSGKIVTNCKGVSYSSMHQWGVAFDFYLKMDVDRDGQTTDDAFNNATRLFNKVGELGQSIGLEWGGSWKSFKDLPHFQLPDWGSTPTRLKRLYGTPDKFRATWGGAAGSYVGSTSGTTNTVSAVTSVPASKSNPVAAKSKSPSYKRNFTTSANLNMRLAPVNGGIVLTIPKGDAVACYGYYTHSGSYDWLFVQYGKYTGYVRRDYLK